MRRIFIYTLMLVSLATSALLVRASRVAAATFNQNNIISDALFSNSSSMSASQIDNFLNQFPSSCISSNDGFSSPDPTGYSPTAGFTYGKNVSAGQTIYDAAEAYGLNPQVLLATLQKEQSLVDGSAGCSTLRYAAAAGYGCPDGGTTYSYSGVDLYSINGSAVTSVSGTCVNSSLKVGFSQQVIRASWLLKFGQERSEGNMSWDIQLSNYPESGDAWNNSDDPQSCYGGPMTQGTWQICPSGSTTYYDGYTTIDGTSVHMDDGATAALYWYTPHFSGNQNFFDIFTSWFGDSSVDVFPWEVAQETGGDGSDWLVVGNTKRWIPTTAIYDDWELNNYPIQQVSSAYFNSIPTIPPLGRLGVLSNGQYVFVGSGTKYLFHDQSSINDWGYENSLSIASPVYSVLGNLQTAGYISQYVQQSGTSGYYLMSAGNLYPINSSYANRWQIGSSVVLDADAISLFTVTTQLNFQITVSGQNYIVDLGKLLNVTSATSSAAYGSLASGFVTVDPSILPFFSTQQASQLIQANNSPNWYYLIAGQTHYILNANIAKAWDTSSQPQIISSDLFGSITLGSNLGTQVHATDSGSYYILDGNKHLVNTSYVPDWFGSAPSVMQLSETDLSPIPQGSNITSPLLRINGTSNVFTVMNGQYYYIQTGAILDGYGYPTKYQITPINVSALSYINYGGSTNQFIISGATTYYLQSGIAYPIVSTYVNSWTSGQSVITYPGTDFVQRFSPSSSQLANLISTPTSRWVVDGGNLLNANQYSDNYSYASWTNMDINDLPTSSVNVTYLARSSTTISDSRIWLINGGTKQWLTNLEEFDGFSGRYMSITPLTDSTLNSIPDTTPANGPSIIIQSGTSGLKLLMDGKYFAFPDGDTLINVVGQNPIEQVTPSIFQTVSKQAGTLTRLIKDSSTQKLYYMQNGQKCWVTSASAYSQYSSIPITTLPSEVVNWFPEGPPIN